MSTYVAEHHPTPTNGRVRMSTDGGRGYVARLVGTHGRYGFAREFERGDRIKKSTTRYYELTEPGWYEHVTYRAGGRRVVTYYAFTGDELEPIPTGLATREQLGKAFGGPAPGSPGAWRGLECECGAAAYTYTRNGYPRCWTHTSSSERDPADRPTTTEETR